MIFLRDRKCSEANQQKKARQVGQFGQASRSASKSCPRHNIIQGPNLRVSVRWSDRLNAHHTLDHQSGGILGSVARNPVLYLARLGEMDPPTVVAPAVA